MSDKQLDSWRHLDLFDPKKHKDLSVTVIGAGGIGSPTVLALAKMGIKDITIWDDDMVELHNLSSQFFGHSHIGMSKVESLSEVVKMFSGLTIKTVNKKFTPADGRQAKGIVISAVDSMEARREIWEGLKLNISVLLYIDSRMGSEVMRVCSLSPFNMTDVRRYEETIDPATPVKKAVCTNKSIIYNVFGIAGIICNQVKKFTADEGYQTNNLISEIIFDFKTISLIKRFWK